VSFPQRSPAYAWEGGNPENEQKVGYYKMILMKVFIRKIFIVSFLLTLIFSFNVAYGDELREYTGTYSTLQYNEEGGDLIGEEIRIVFTKSGHKAIIQIAEGVPSELIVVPITLEKGILYFKINNDILYDGVFKGKINKKGIKGVLKFKTGGEMELNLPRKKSYWD
jgi:hypothetical protein